MTISNTTHNGDPEVGQLVAELRFAFNELGAKIAERTGGRRASIALTHLETASMYAIKAATVGDA